MKKIKFPYVGLLIFVSLLMVMTLNQCKTCGCSDNYTIRVGDHRYYTDTLTIDATGFVTFKQNGKNIKLSPGSYAIESAKPIPTVENATK
jgi:hypothetical protein